jgi:hypothetical protein
MADEVRRRGRPTREQTVEEQIADAEESIAQAEEDIAETEELIATELPEMKSAQSGEGRNGDGRPPIPVAARLGRSSARLGRSSTPDTLLWYIIQHSTDHLRFSQSARFIDAVLCGEELVEGSPEPKAMPRSSVSGKKPTST